MPQKSHTGTFEQVRTKTAAIVGSMMGLITAYQGEPFQDVLPVLDSSPRFALPATCEAESQIEFVRHLLNAFHPRPERMKQNMLSQFSGAPDLQAYLVREHGYGLRRAHKIVATMVRLARERSILPTDLTGTLLDEAAQLTEEPAPGVDTATVVDYMTFKGFFDRHCSTGDPCACESKRMITGRREKLARLESEQSGRREQVERSRIRLAEEMDAILNKGMD
jgi:argininosuccinate lyase